MDLLPLGVNNLSNSGKKAAAILSILMMMVLVVTPRLFSQGAVGTILGGVHDSSGAAIAGAKVTVTDVARGTTRVLMTDQTGQYTAPSLLVWHLLGARRSPGIPDDRTHQRAARGGRKRSCRSESQAWRTDADRYGHRRSRRRSMPPMPPSAVPSPTKPLARCPWSHATSSTCSNCARGS